MNLSPRSSRSLFQHMPTSKPAYRCSSPTQSSSKYQSRGSLLAPGHYLRPVPTGCYTHELSGLQPAVLVKSSATSTSDRSSFSSAHYDESWAQTDSIYSSTPMVKIEDQSDNVIEGEETGTSISDMSRSRLVNSVNSYACRLEPEFSQDTVTLKRSKGSYPASLDAHSVLALPVPLCNKRSESQGKSPARPRNHHTTPSLMVQTGQSRRFITDKDANFHCQMQGCNKPFYSIYSFKVHMRSHVMTQRSLFPCSFKDCSKGFTRKTDLTRHYQCVHVKQRNHYCYFCNQSFTRKDTMRR